eukprot:11186059-Lingulodinium_polyedra.AAC.1
MSGNQAACLPASPPAWLHSVKNRSFRNSANKLPACVLDVLNNRDFRRIQEISQTGRHTGMLACLPACLPAWKLQEQC